MSADDLGRDRDGTSPPFIGIWQRWPSTELRQLLGQAGSDVGVPRGMGMVPVAATPAEVLGLSSRLSARLPEALLGHVRTRPSAPCGGADEWRHPVGGGGVMGAGGWTCPARARPTAAT